MKKTKNNVVDMTRFLHPKIGHVYEIDDDVIVLVLDKLSNMCEIRILNPDEAYYGKAIITMSNDRFGHNNHLGSYEELVNGR